MARLIDADELFPCANDKFGIPVKPNDKWETSLNELRAYIAKQPTIDPVKHGHWIYDGGYAYICSVCGESMEWMPPYCCECGANMIPQIISTEESLEKDRYTKLKDCIKMIQDGENTIMAIASMLESIEHQDKEVSE